MQVLLLVLSVAAPTQVHRLLVMLSPAPMRHDVQRPLEFILALSVLSFALREEIKSAERVRVLLEGDLMFFGLLELGFELLLLLVEVLLLLALAIASGVVKVIVKGLGGVLPVGELG